MLLVFKFQKSVLKPGYAMKSIIKSTIRSSLFLALYVTIGWCLPCYLRNLFGVDRKWMYYINGLLAGTMVLIESPGRQLELALYCLPRAIESLWNCLVKWGYTRNIRYFTNLEYFIHNFRGGEAVYFSLSTGIVMTLYQHDPDCIQEG